MLLEHDHASARVVDKACSQSQVCAHLNVYTRVRTATSWGTEPHLVRTMNLWSSYTKPTWWKLLLSLPPVRLCFWSFWLVILSVCLSNEQSIIFRGWSGYRIRIAIRYHGFLGKYIWGEPTCMEDNFIILMTSWSHNCCVLLKPTHLYDWMK